MSTTTNSKLSITYLLTESLIADFKNPRQHSKKQIKQIAQSIETFGFNSPLLINGLNQVLCGHGRLLAAQELELKEVPTICIDHLAPLQARAFMIADNKLVENSKWDKSLLAEHFIELTALGLDFSIDITGFEMAEIDLIIEDLSIDTKCKPDPADQLPSETSETVTKLDDLWQLGRHRIFCGNALEQASYETILSGKQAHLIFTDPPYNVKIDGHVSGKGKNKHREFAMASGEMSEAEFTAFLAHTCSLLSKNSVSGSIHYIFMDWRHAGELLIAGKEAYTELKNICVWAKNNGGMGSLYRSQHELIFVFKHGKEPHCNNVELGKYGRYRTNVWNYPGANSFGAKGDEDNPFNLHPTVKPVALVADAIMDCSMRGDIVLDSFLGSGSTLIAAEKVGRICYGIELDPLYVDTAIRRWQKWTGDTAYHAVTGQSFNEVAAKMEVSND